MHAHFIPRYSWEAPRPGLKQHNNVVNENVRFYASSLQTIVFMERCAWIWARSLFRRTVGGLHSKQNWTWDHDFNFQRPGLCKPAAMSIIAIERSVYRHEKHAITTTVHERKQANDMQGGVWGFYPRWDGWRFDRKVNLRGQEKAKAWSLEKLGNVDLSRSICLNITMNNTDAGKTGKLAIEKEPW